MATISVTMTPAKDVDESDPWLFQLFGCLDDPRLCIFTFLLPCYTIGRNAEHFEEDGVVIGLFYGLGMCALAPMLRWRIRQKKNLEGNMLADVLVHAFCPCCALIQESKELYGLHGSHVGEKLPITQDIERK